MIYYSVIDTNILVSALLSRHFDSAAVQVVNRLFDGDIIPLLNERILAEYNEVLRRDKFHFAEETIITLLSVIEKYGEFVTANLTDSITLFDMKDVPFYEAVVEKQSERAYLITGNLKHFPQKSFIVSPREFLNIIIPDRF